ncbi:MAG: hypothetical protein GKS06_18990 [Acidobacteria bacterium]|nr:hypothetical protein [Acidobacteriota bacterium]
MSKLRPSFARAVRFCLIPGALLSAQSTLAQQELSIESEAFQETREIIVHLPENYDPASEEGYPVIYALDPDNPEEEPSGQYDDAIARAARDYHQAGIMPEAIVIGIRNIRRGLDFLPHYYSGERDGEQIAGNGDKTLAFINDELIPYASEHFRANGQRVFMGHSWSGQFLAYTLSQSPGTFDAYFITSPAFARWKDRTFSALEQTLEQGLGLPDFVYVSVGADEEATELEDYESLTSFFEQHLPEEVELHHEVNEGLNHDDNGLMSQPRALKLYFQSLP